MTATYKQFLAAPSSSLLADTAALYYVTTTTTFSGPTQIIKHLNGLQKVVAKKKEDVFNVVDGGNLAVFEIDTGLGFQTGGGPYLPGLDDNFLSARDVYLPITHFVTFDEAGKISQIRVQWDQGSLLKQVEVIGKSGRNWPIRDSREQITYIRSAIKSAGTAPPAPLSHNESIARTRGNTGNAFRDPHASLQLFGSREEIETEPVAVVSPYAGTRPRQRSFTEILGHEPDSPSQQMSPSKAGQGKNFQPMRLFDGYEHTDVPDQPLQQNKRYIRPNPNKYSHFDFADGSDPQDAPQKGVSIDEKPKSKHDSQWSFEDFVTPQKVKPSRGMRTNDVGHWGADENTADKTTAQPAALGNITNVNRGKDFDHQFDIADQSPAQKENKPVQEPTNDSRIRTAGDGMGGRRGTTRDWLYGETEEVAQSIPARQANVPAAGVPLNKSSKITTAGDGMGGRKGTERDWLYNETQEEPSQSVPGRKLGASGVPSETKDSKIAIAGDGMGGRKGTNRDWLYGDLTEQPLPVRKQPARPAKSDFWDF